MTKKNSKTTATTTTTVGKYVDYRVLPAFSSLSLRQNRIFDVGGGGGWNNGGKEERSAPGEAKTPIIPPRTMTKTI